MPEPSFINIAGHLILRVGDQEQSLGIIQVPVRVTSAPDGNINLTAETRQVRDYVEQVFAAEARNATTNEPETRHA